jgi:hypothetical protein
MTESELGHLARHLGHDAKTHKEFYRLNHSTVQLSKVYIRFSSHFEVRNSALGNHCGDQNSSIFKMF